MSLEVSPPGIHRLGLLTDSAWMVTKEAIPSQYEYDERYIYFLYRGKLWRKKSDLEGLQKGWEPAPTKFKL